jgi:hypothetical protein
MTQKWEYVTVPLLVHATKQILDNWGDEGWELVAVVPAPSTNSGPEYRVEGHVHQVTGELSAAVVAASSASAQQLVAYMKRPKQ